MTDENKALSADLPEDPAAAETEIAEETTEVTAETETAGTETSEAEAEETVTVEEAIEASPLLKEALTAGVAPLEMRFSQINSCFRRAPVALRSFTYVNSVIEGVIPPEKYAFAADGTERGVRLARWNLSRAIHAVRSLEAQGIRPDFVTARCPANLCLEEDLYEWMRAFLEEKDFHEPEMLCLEFSQSLLFEDPEKVRASLLGMKLLKVKTMMTGCGETDCPIATLIRVPVDYVILAPWLTALADSRGKGASVAALAAFIRSLGIQVIGDGAQNDAQISSLSRADSYGYIPSSGYQGTVEHGKLRMTLTEVIDLMREESY